MFVTPHSNSVDMQLRAESWDGEPLDDTDRWAEVFEASLLAAENGVVWSSPTDYGLTIPVSAGRYRARISGGDFLRPRWNESDGLRYSDNYRIQLWPSDVPTGSQRRRRWSHPSSCGHL